MTDYRSLDLEYTELDVAAARAELAAGEWDIRIVNATRPSILNSRGRWEPFRPSTSWSHAGPIIERERIELQFRHGQWAACTGDEHNAVGSTPLVAAMRAYVVSRAKQGVPELRSPGKQAIRIWLCLGRQSLPDSISSVSVVMSTP